MDANERLKMLMKIAEVGDDIQLWLRWNSFLKDLEESPASPEYEEQFDVALKILYTLTLAHQGERHGKD